jgi:protein gp37
MYDALIFVDIGGRTENRVKDLYLKSIPAILLDSPLDISRHTNLKELFVGGESGPGARPIHEKWVTDIRDQCKSGRHGILL